MQPDSQREQACGIDQRAALAYQGRLRCCVWEGLSFPEAHDDFFSSLCCGSPRNDRTLWKPATIDHLEEASEWGRGM